MSPANDRQVLRPIAGGKFFSLLANDGAFRRDTFRQSMVERLEQTEHDLHQMAIIALTDPSKQPLALRLQGRLEELRDLIAFADYYKPTGV